QASATGLNLTTTSHGLAALDGSGNTVFTAAPPIMWDSTDHPGVGPAPTATDPGGANITALPYAMAPANGLAPVGAPAAPTAHTPLSLQPPAAALTGPGLPYPLYLDPSISPAMQDMAVVFSSGGPYYNSAAGMLDIGDCAWPGCNGIGVARSYFDLNIQ